MTLALTRGLDVLTVCQLGFALFQEVSASRPFLEAYYNRVSVQQATAPTRSATGSPCATGQLGTGAQAAAETFSPFLEQRQEHIHAKPAKPEVEIFSH